MSLTLVTAPSGNVLTMSQVYDHLRVDLVGSPAEPADATYITALRDAAEAYLDGDEGILGRALLTQTWDLKLDAFPGDRYFRWDHAGRTFSDEIQIPLPPLQSVTSISYVDTNGATQTLASSVYQVVTNGKWPARIVAAYGQTFPEARDQPNAVTVRFVAGYGTASDVPAQVHHALRLLISQWYENREPVVVGKTAASLPMAFDALIDPLVVRAFG